MILKSQVAHYPCVSNTLHQTRATHDKRKSHNWADRSCDGLWSLTPKSCWSLTSRIVPFRQDSFRVFPFLSRVFYSDKMTLSSDMLAPIFSNYKWEKRGNIHNSNYHKAYNLCWAFRQVFNQNCSRPVSVFSCVFLENQQKSPALSFMPECSTG